MHLCIFFVAVPEPEPGPRSGLVMTVTILSRDGERRYEYINPETF